MPSKTQQTLFDNFQAVAADRGLASVLDAGKALASSLERAAAQVSQMQGSEKQASGIGGAVASGVAKVFTSGLGLVPLVGSLLGLFGGGGSPEPPALVKYAMPERLFFQGADVGGGIASADYDQMGTPRAYATTQSPDAASAATGAGPQITVNVQAMDSRSFLDHSTEIAQAVRQAMLHLNSINDVVSDL